MSRSSEQIRRSHQINRSSWNAVTDAHNSHKRDQAGFLREGGSTLFPEERELLGALEDQTLLHLQCNCGQDSLSLARLGATVTGVDISDRAIEVARTLSRDSGIEAQFEREDVLEWLPRAASEERRFDRVFSSYGSIYWLADLDAWARGVHGVLAPDGRLVLVEFHPMAWCIDGSGKLYDAYFNADTIENPDGVGDYVGRSGPALAPSGYESGEVEFRNPQASHEFQWTLAQIVQAVVSAGLRIELLREYPFSNGCQLWPSQRIDAQRRVTPAPGIPSYPLMFGLVARR